MLVNSTFSRVSMLILVSFSILSFTAKADDYIDGALLRAEGDIKVYLINNNVKKWISSIEVFNSRNFNWKNVQVVPKKEIATIKEGDPIILEKVSPVPASTASPQASPSIIPVIIAPPIQSPIPAKINLRFPAPDYIRADWVISRATSDFGRVGQKIVFKYSIKERYQIENFRLYEKKPGDSFFHKIADFSEVLSTNCEDIDIDGDWMILEAGVGQCGYWSIQRTVPPGGRGVIAYLSSTNFLEGEYSYYVVGVDRDGLETQPSLEAKLVFLKPISILEPVDKQQVQIYPVFRWSVANSWPESSMPDYFIYISDNEVALNPLWGKQIKVPREKFDESAIHDGLGLDPTKKYKVYIYGHYRKSEYDPDYISIPHTVPEFRIKSTNSILFLPGLLKALFLNSFDLFH